MKTKTILFYSDPGHGWAKVSIRELNKLGIADKITTYSYMRGDYAYLEEDCDLTTYVNALRDAGYKDEQIKFKGTTSAYRQSRIRGYDYYSYKSLNQQGS